MKTLILHASAGNGHRRAAEALSKAFLLCGRASEVAVRDILDFTPAIFRRTYAQGYLRLVRKVPELWSYLYSASDRKAQDPWRQKVRSTFNRINAAHFGEFYDEFDPDVVVCTHFMPLELIAARTRRKKARVPIFCSVTDFAVHALWLVRNVDCYYVATDEARRQLLRRGVSPRHVMVSGIPVDPVFEQRIPVAAARRALGIRADLPTVLILSGGFGVGPMVELVRAFGSNPLACQLLLVAGANERLRRDLEAEARGLKMPVRVFGFVDNIHEMMDASDMVVGKPGGLTVSEVLAKGKPFMVFEPIPGQEQRNCEFLLESGVAARLLEAGDLPAKLQELLADPRRLAGMREQSEKAGHPRASMDIVEDILRRVGD